MFRDSCRARLPSTLFIAAALALGAAGCDIDQTREGEMPEVEVRGGQLPEYDVETPEVEVTQEPTTIDVPELDIETREETVDLPRIDITVPEDDVEDRDDTVDPTE